MAGCFRTHGRCGTLASHIYNKQQIPTQPTKRIGAKYRDIVPLPPLPPAVLRPSSIPAKIAQAKFATAKLAKAKFA